MGLQHTPHPKHACIIAVHHTTTTDAPPCCRVRSISSNDLSGTIPASLGSMDGLTYLYVRLVVHSCYGRLCRSVTTHLATHSLTHSLRLSLTRIPACPLTPEHTNPDPYINPLTHSLTPSLPHSLSLTLIFSHSSMHTYPLS